MRRNYIRIVRAAATIATSPTATVLGLLAEMRLFLPEVLSPFDDSSPTLVSLPEEDDPFDIDPAEPVSLHSVIIWFNKSLSTKTFRPGIVQSPRFSAATSFKNAMQKELSHRSIIWSAVTLERVFMLNPVSAVQPARYMLFDSFTNV